MNIAVIGAGFGGLSAGAYVAKAGHTVTIFEKNDMPGGRAGTYSTDGFHFDTGPSWYQMPDVYDEFFADFGHTTADFFELKLLTPSYRVFRQGRGSIDIGRGSDAIDQFERIDPGSGERLRRHLQSVSEEYDTVRAGILSTSGLSPTDYVRLDTLSLAKRAHHMARRFATRSKSVTKNDDLRHVLEFMTVFLGGSPHNIPGAYSLINHVDMGQGVRYPYPGGFTTLARAYESIAKENGATIIYKTAVEAIRPGREAIELSLSNGTVRHFDRVIANADYQYVETQLLSRPDRSYDESYWRTRTLSPSAVIGLVGTKRRIDGLLHHNLFFDADWDAHFRATFKTHSIPDKPLFYVGVPSKTDNTVAPIGSENLFILIPLSGKASVDDELARQLVEQALHRIEAATGSSVIDALVTNTVYGPDYFTSRFNASQANAFGLAHTLRQTGPLRPRVRSRTVPQLYYVGQFTNPGTGVPLVTLGGKVVARQLIHDAGA